MDKSQKSRKKKKHRYPEDPQHHRPKKQQQGTTAADVQFKPSADVKGVRFGSQFIVKSFTVRRASPIELLHLLDVQPAAQHGPLPFPSATGYMPTNFTILAHHAWHTLTLGLGTRKSKVLLFLFETESMKLAVDRLWPVVIPLGEVNKRLVRGLQGCEMARFKFRKGALTFYVYAVRRAGAGGFPSAEDLRRLLEAVVKLRDFMDHTAMLAMPNQRSITFSQPVACVH